MRVSLSILGVSVVALSAIGAGRLWQTENRRIPSPTSAAVTLLHNGWKVTPAGEPVGLPGDMPGSIVAIPDTPYVVVNTCGYHDHSVNLLDTRTHKLVQSIEVGRCWIGMAYDAGLSELYVSGGPAQSPISRLAKPDPDLPVGFKAAILRFHFTGEKLVPERGLDLPIPKESVRYVSGLLSASSGDLYAANIQTDTILRMSGPGLPLAAVSSTRYRPYALALSPDGSTLAVSNWGDRSVSLLDPKTLHEVANIQVYAHPTSLAFAPDGRLFVANSGDHRVSVIRGRKVVEDIVTSIHNDAKIGSTPISLSIADGRLYVANADNNDVAVVDISRAHAARVLGFIPTGAYPSVVLAGANGLMIATAKGLHDGPNATEAQSAASVPDGPNGVGKRAEYTYAPNLLQGTLSFLPTPTFPQIAAFTRQVISNLPEGARASELSEKAQKAILNDAFRKIHHVIYIIRENRTYDEVLGDVPAGNGDARLTLFPEQVTPNSHDLVSKFVLLDNLYCDGEVSQVGHQWTDAAYANDYCQKQWLMEYGRHVEVESDTRMFTSPGGYLWQNVKRHGKTSRIYGEYLEWQEDHSSATGAVKLDPEKFGCSEAFEKVFARDGRDTEKTDVFLNEMHAAEKTGKWPNFMVVALNEDHTRGSSPGAHTPWACVGSNDLALGRLVDGVSHSKFWKDTAIFVIQDDAQDGPDHVDMHRTVGLVISPYTRQNGLVDSTMYSTCSMIRTMELILGLPPMSQYDAFATPMYRSFTTKPDFSPYSVIGPKIDLEAMNPSKGPLALRSEKLDFSDIDRADPAEFNAVLWDAIRPGQKMPPPVVSHWASNLR